MNAMIIKSFEDLDIKFNPLIPNLTINSHLLPVSENSPFYFVQLTT